MDSEFPDEIEPVQLPVNGVLDLHHFHAKDVKELLPVYFEECLAKGITEVRVIHGKGTGALRELVHAQLRKNPLVSGFGQAGESGGGWGATIVSLKPARPDRSAKL